jgi:arylsulfatase A-like enzyme
MDPDVYMTDYLADEAAKLVASRQQQSGDDAFVPAPYFLLLAFNAPHNPYQALISDLQSADVQALPTQTERVYAAMVKALDRGVGKVLQAVRDSGQEQNTAVLFTSDNGGAHYAGLPGLNHPFRGWKATLFEGGLRVPLFLQWPGRLRPCTHSAPVSHVDFLPTLVAMAGGGVAGHGQAPLDGIDLLSALGEQCSREQPAEAAEATADMTRASNRTLFWRSGHYSAVLLHDQHDQQLSGQWKLQVAGRPSKVWFFDLSSDPTERHNLAPKLGVLNREDLDALSWYRSQEQEQEQEQSQQQERSQQQEQVQEQELVRAYRTLLALEGEQREPLWPALSETPVRIDCTQQQAWDSDELVYWCN